MNACRISYIDEWQWHVIRFFCILSSDLCSRPSGIFFGYPPQPCTLHLLYERGSSDAANITYEMGGATHEERQVELWEWLVCLSPPRSSRWIPCMFSNSSPVPNRTIQPLFTSNQFLHCYMDLRSGGNVGTFSSSRLTALGDVPPCGSIR